MMEESISTLEATVTAINHDTREVTLQDAAGESVTIIADDEVRNLAQVEVDDKVMIEYLESVSIQVLGPEAEVGAEVVEGMARAEPGEKPAGAAVSEMTIVVEIEAIEWISESNKLKPNIMPLYCAEELFHFLKCIYQNSYAPS